MKKTKYPGIYYYKQKNGVKSFYAVVKNAGVQRWIRVGSSVEGVTAKKAYDFKLEFALRAKSKRMPKSELKLTLNDLAKSYFKTFRGVNKSNKFYKQLWEKHIKESLGKIKVRDLKNSDLIKFQSGKAKEISVGSVNLLIKLIKRVINFAVKDGVIPPKPLAFKQIKEDNGRVRYLSLEEIERLKSLVREDEEVYLFVLIALTTGARVKSILELRQKDINFADKSISFLDHKRGNRYIAFLDAEVEQLLKKRVDAHKNKRLFSISYGRLHYKLSKAFSVFNVGLSKKDRANRVVIHTLRHTFASHLALQGVPIQRIQKLLNHKSINVTLRYAKLDPNSGRSEVEKLYKCKG